MNPFSYTLSYKGHGAIVQCDLPLLHTFQLVGCLIKDAVSYGRAEAAAISSEYEIGIAVSIGEDILQCLCRLNGTHHPREYSNKVCLFDFEADTHACCFSCRRK